MQHARVSLTRRAQLRLLGAGPAGVAAAMALAGCGTGPRVPTESKGAALQPAKLVWQVRGGPTYEQLVKEAIALFRQQQPQITIDTVLGAGNNEKTLTTLVAGDGPDILQSWPPNIWELAAKGQIQNLNELTRDLRKSDVDDFVKFQWEAVVIPTTSFRYGLPTYVDMDVLFYNKQLLRQRGVREPTADWGRDEYAAALKQLTFTDSATGNKVWGGYKPANGFIRGQNLVTMFGGHFVDPKDLTKTQLHLPEAQRGLEWARVRLFDDQTWAPLDPARRTWQPNTPRDGFLQGVIAMYEEGMYQLQRIAQGMEAEWEIQHIPKGPAKRTGLGDTDVWSMWRQTRARDAAWLLLKFITTPPFYEMQARHDLLIPSRKSVLETWVKVVREKFAALTKVNLKVITDALTTMGYPTPTENFLCQSEAGKVVNPALNQIFRDGTARPLLFRDIRDQIDAAAASCGFSFK